MRPHLIFAYNADSGLFNTVTDIAHKILSPDTYSCNLCALTHGHFKVREEWVRFLETLDADCDFLHRDELRETYPMDDIKLPAIFMEQDGQLSVLVDADTIAGIQSIDQLVTTLNDRLAAEFPPPV